MTPSPAATAGTQTAFITGGTGFLGSQLARRLARDGWEVHLLCRPQSDFWRLQSVLPHIHRHVGTLEDLDGLRGIVSKVRPEFIFHLASATVVAGSAAAAGPLVTANLLGTVNLLDACETTDYRGMVIAGDSFEYAASHAPLDETNYKPPNSLHGITKLAATLYAQSIASARSRPVLILRLFSTYGPYDNSRRLVPRVIAGALAGTPLSLSRRGITRDWVYVDDMVDLFVEAARRAGQKPGRVFNAGSGIPTDLGTIVDTVLRLTGASAEPAWGAFPEPEHDAWPWVADVRGTFSEFDWRPVTNLEAGLRATILSIQTSQTLVTP
jgi:nucleoside-diphosphate-sugar epimerase